eukprot:SAG31_NODE_45652_length_258_cov_0.641509_1_plen_63_part_01
MHSAAAAAASLSVLLQLQQCILQLQHKCFLVLPILCATEAVCGRGQKRCDDRQMELRMLPLPM